MHTIYTKSFDDKLKDLKRHKKEQQYLDDIIDFLNDLDKFDDLFDNSIAAMYGFEALKYQNNGFYSFNLCKNGGTIRLIVERLEDDVALVYISYDHYKDFNPRKVRYYE